MNTLFIGNKNYSSWSLRPWLCLRWGKIQFQENLIRLDQTGYGKNQIPDVLSASPSGTVPALHTDHIKIWDSLSIAEWAAEKNSELWPSDPDTRALARSVTCEMHSGFASIRQHLTMNIKRRCKGTQWNEDTQRAIKRVISLWTQLRTTYPEQGPWLFGKRSIADAFFTPVATRFRTYSVDVPQLVQQYMDTVLSDADFTAWEAECIPDSWDKSGFSVVDNLYR